MMMMNGWVGGETVVAVAHAHTFSPGIGSIGDDSPDELVCGFHGRAVTVFGVCTAAIVWDHHPYGGGPN